MKTKLITDVSRLLLLTLVAVSAVAVARYRVTLD